MWTLQLDTITSLGVALGYAHLLDLYYAESLKPVQMLFWLFTSRAAAAG
jgi:hypothetical protein